MSYIPFLKGGETWRREIKGNTKILFTQREMFMKIPSSVSWHHLVVNISCFRDQSFLWMVLIVLRLSWYVSESSVLSPFSCVRLFGTSRTITFQASLFMNCPGKNTGVGCYALLQRIFPTQGLNPDLLYCRQILYG